ncbi:kinetochore protein Spc25-like [Lucilia sericata]|uniref:kinetochore protein Spc25-like n=1 Tax=Lucilia sericata TaxID=13632 RepID=UPI0018A862DC|nr:kinetochore protein Spc25-like [Lucilia sericata]
MSKYDFARRIKRIVHAECDITKVETKIAHKSAKYYEQMSSLKTTLAKQELELKKYQKEVAKLKRENDKLEKFKQNEEERLCDTIQKVEKMQVEYQQTLQQQIEQRRAALLQMDCIHSIKQATQTYINLNALPQLIQGVAICEKESSSDWRPFRIDPSKHTLKEVQDLIWHDSDVGLVHRETWEKLILGDILSDTSKNMESENDNATMVI